MLQQYYAGRACGFAKFLVIGCERKAAADGEFKIGRVLGGLTVGAHQVQCGSEGPGWAGFIQNQIQAA
jgi:hypothetical protein